MISNKTLPSSASGFTLVELVIAISILAVLSVFTADALRRAILNKERTNSSFDGQSKVRDVLKIIERDINLSFHYIDYHAQLYNLSQEERIQRNKDSKKKSTSDKKKDTKEDPDKKNPSEDPDAKSKDETDIKEAETFTAKKEVSYTEFIGTEDAMDFASLNMSQTRANQSNSDQGEIGYYIKECKNRLDKNKSSKCLFRRVAHLIDDVPEEGGDATVLLENIEEFKLEYLGDEEGAEWVKSWASNSEGLSDATKDKFPLAVKIQLAIKEKTTSKVKKNF